MIYSSEVILDLALLFPFIEKLEAAYAKYDIGIEYKIEVRRTGFKVRFTTYAIRQCNQKDC